MNQTIPLSTLPNQTLSVTLSIDSTLVPVILNVVFNEMANYWVLTIFDNSSNLLVDSVPMVTGTWPAANLLGQQGYLGIGSWFVLNVSGTPNDYPDSTNLGTDFQLIVGDTPPVN